MKKIASTLLVALLCTAVVLAHGDMEHVLGTVAEITDHSISVKTGDGSIKTVAYDAETQFLKGGSPATAKDVVVGIRVVIHAHKNGDRLHAAEIKIGANPTTHHLF
jgi:hypothetical protein